MRFTVGDYVRNGASIGKIEKIEVVTSKYMGLGTLSFPVWDTHTEEFNSLETLDIDYKLNKKRRKGKLSRQVKITYSKGFFQINHKWKPISECYEGIRVAKDVAKLVDIDDMVKRCDTYLGIVTFINGYARHLSVHDMETLDFRDIEEIWTRRDDTYGLQWKKEVE